MPTLTKALPDQTRDLILRLAAENPTLADLSPQQAEAVAKAVLGDMLKDQMKKAVLSARINFDIEVETFLGDQKSVHTRRTYAMALKAFAEWLSHQNLEIADLTPARADDFIRHQRTLGKDEDTVRLRVAVMSSFFTFLERRYVEIRNPFRGTKARPKSTWSTAVIPTTEEIATIIDRADPVTKVAVMIMVETGLRVGGLAELRIKPDGTFYAITKGKRFEGFEPMSDSIVSAIKAAGLSTFRPFNPDDRKGRGGSATSVAKVTVAISAKILRLCASLKESGEISAAFSPHDFRHAFAESNGHRGLAWLRDRLGHASIMVTERYLRNSLGVRSDLVVL